MLAVFKWFKNCSSEDYGELLIDACSHPRAAMFHSTTSVRGTVGKGVGWCDWQSESAAWLSEAERRRLDSPSFCHGAESLCLSAFLGQHDHSTAMAHTDTSASAQTDVTVYNHTLKGGVQRRNT